MSSFREALAQHRAATFCVVTFALSWALWFATVYPLAVPLLATSADTALSDPIAFVFVAAGMLVPAISVVITRLLTGEGFRRAWIRPRAFRRTWKYYVIGWFGPIALMALGAAVFYLIFPSDFDPSMSATMSSIEAQLAASGQGASMSAGELRAITYAQLGLVFIAPLLNCIACFGEEWGWRGYLLPKLMERHSSTYAIVVGGIIWGLWHAPIIALGHNYGLNYPGWPIAGIVAMCIFTTFIGAFLSWLTIRSGSCIPAVFAHGALNGCAAVPLMFAAYATSPFLGPAPTGIIGAIGFVIVGILCTVALKRKGLTGIDS